MPENQPSSQSPNPRLRGDMYLRAERRRLAEFAAELAEMQAAPIGRVYQAEPLPGSDVSAANTAVDPVGLEKPPVSDVSAITAGGVADAHVPVLAATPASGDTTLPIRPAISSTGPVTVAPARTSAQARTLPRGAVRRSLVPAAIFAPVILIAVLGIGLLMWPAGAEAPASARSQEDPGASASGSGAPTAAVAPAPSPAPVPSASAKAEAPVVRGNELQPTALPPRQSAQPSVVRAARQESAAPVRPLATEGVIRVTSTPAGARVTVNGIGWGQTPLTVDHLPLGTKTVRVTRDGYNSQQRLVDLRGERPSASLHVTLQRGR